MIKPTIVAVISMFALVCAFVALSAFTVDSSALAAIAATLTLVLLGCALRFSDAKGRSTLVLATVLMIAEILLYFFTQCQAFPYWMILASLVTLPIVLGLVIALTGQRMVVRGGRVVLGKSALSPVGRYSTTTREFTSSPRKR